MRRVGDISIGVRDQGDGPVLERHRRPLSERESGGEFSRRATRKWRLPLITRRMRRWAGLCATLTLICAPGAWLSLSPEGQKLIERTGDELLDASAGFGYRVESVMVEGRARTDRNDLAAALGVNRGDPIFAIDLEAARQRLEGLSWIESASLLRRLPGEIHISITERHPVALWQNRGNYRLVDARGMVVGDQDDALAAMSDSPLLLIVGDGAPEETAGLLALLEAHPALKARIKAAQWISGRRWTLRLDNAETGIAIRLPEENPDAALAVLERLDQSEQLLSRRISLVDLRLPDRIVLRTAPLLRPDQEGADEKSPSERDA